MNLGLMLKNKRIECGMLQEEVAKKMGLSQKTISSWEIGRTVPKMDDYEKLSRIFGCTINELTGRRDYDLSRLSLFPKPNKIKASERFSDLRVAFHVAYNAKIRRSTPKNEPPSAKGKKAL